MNNRSRWRLRACATAVALLSLAGGAFAQVQTGNVFGDVKDDKGQALPGVPLTLPGSGAPVV